VQAPGTRSGRTPVLHRRLGALSLESVRMLFRFKSFFLLIFVIAWVDRGVRPLVEQRAAGMRLSHLKTWTADLPERVFVQLPDQLVAMIFDPRAVLILAGLFFLKQVISLWPSNDMRRMHRQERGRFGLWQSLLALSWRQVLWDAVALGSLMAFTGVWLLAAWAICRTGWVMTGSRLWLAAMAGLAGLGMPQLLAGFSFSSKLAVVQRGRFAEKLALFFKIFSDVTVAIPVWGFFALRIILESVFVGAIPGVILLAMATPWLRILLAGLLATPAYAFLKMISFKFFLETYGRFDLVRGEYADFYARGAT
jgi:hypothetical protein